MRNHVSLLPMAACVLMLVGTVMAAENFAGTFRGDGLVVKLSVDMAGYAGSIERGGQVYAVRAIVKDGKLEGTFSDKDLTITDPQTRLPAWMFMAPADWQHQGAVIWTGHTVPACWSSAFRGTQNLVDPSTGTTHWGVQSGYSRNFITNSGVIYGTDDMSYDPWVNEKIRATEMTPGR